jgi:hypothetical protein
MPEERCPYVMQDRRNEDGSLWQASPAHRRRLAAPFATGRPPVSSCSLDPTQALAGWQAGRQTQGGKDSLALAEEEEEADQRTKPRRETTSLTRMSPGLAQDVNVPEERSTSSSVSNKENKRLTRTARAVSRKTRKTTTVMSPKARHA